MKSPAAAERGFTLIELMVAMALSIFVGAAVLTFLVVTFKQENNISSRTAATDQAESGLEQLVRDLREAMTSVSISTTGNSTTISFYVPTPGNNTTGESVVWTCPSTAEASTYYAGSCTRVLTPATGSAITKTEITGVQSIGVTPLSSSNTALSLPVTNSTSVASVGITLTVQITNYELGTCPTGSSCIGQAKSVVSADSGHPIVLNTTADLRNFG